VRCGPERKPGELRGAVVRLGEPGPGGNVERLRQNRSRRDEGARGKLYDRINSTSSLTIANKGRLLSRWQVGIALIPLHALAERYALFPCSKPLHLRADPHKNLPSRQLRAQPHSASNLRASGASYSLNIRRTRYCLLVRNNYGSSTYLRYVRNSY
jgi:hypothetical protein